MKKVFLIFLVVLMALALVACKQEQKDNGGDDSGSSAMPVEKEAGQEALYAKGQSGTRDIGDTGFRIVVEASEDFVDVGGKNDIFWIGTTEEYTYFADIGGKSYWYGDPDGDDVLNWVDITEAATYAYNGTVKENLFGPIVNGLLYQTYGMTSSIFVRGENETHQGTGRTCATYSFNYGPYSLKYWIDLEFGFVCGIKYVGLDEDFDYNMTKCELSNASTPDGIPTYE